MPLLPSSTARPQGLIFDCDGTLADSMPLHWRAWQTVLRRHRLHLDQKRFYAMGGIPSRDILKTLAAEQGVSIDHLAAAREKEEAYLPLVSRIKPIPAVVAIAQAHLGQVPMAVASGGSRRVIEIVLEHLQIRHLFQTVVTNEDVARQKPAPDIFLEAARRLGVLPRHCHAYEDTDLGMEAIRAAGMHAIDVRLLLASAPAGPAGEHSSRPNKHGS